MKNTLWIDVSDLHEWKGTLTGIQRVSYNIAKQYFENKESLGWNVRFTIFDQFIDDFCEIDMNQIIDKVVNLDTASNVHTVGDEEQAVLGGRRAQVKKIYHAATPEKLRSKVNYYRHVRKIGTETKDRQEANASSRVGEEFSKGDLLLVPGANWDNLGMLSAISRLKEDVGLKYVQIVFDLIPVVKKEFLADGAHLSFEHYIEFLADKADHILAISKSTKQDLISVGGIKKSKVSVFRLAEDFTKVADSEKPNYNVEAGEFILCVGTFEARKNHMLIYYMVKRAMEKGTDMPPFVIVGRQGWMTEALGRMITRDSSLEDKIILVHDGTDENLNWFYKNCKMTIYPSFYEGWGLPIAESLFYGKFCLSSNTSSMTEIAGGGMVEHFSPYDINEAMDLVVRYNSDDALLKEKEALIKQKYSPTTWVSSYEQTLKQVKKLLT